MRSEASILHLDMDAFFAAVEQRDKPSLRGEAVIVGGVGTRGVVATASYEARKLGVHSAMSASEARRLAPDAVFLAGRRQAYKQSSRIVMDLLRELSPIIEPLSIDEAFVDLAAGGIDCRNPEDLELLARRLRAQLFIRTEGLTASVGIGTSKLMAKLGSEAAKPNGYKVWPVGTEIDVLSEMKVQAIPGVGPATTIKLNRLGIETVEDLQKASEKELVRALGEAAGHSLKQLAFGRDDRPVVSVRAAKSISTEDTFEVDVTDRAELDGFVDRDAADVSKRLLKAGLFAKTITLKARLADFTTYTRSRTIAGATDNCERIALIAKGLLDGIEIEQGIRLLGIGVSNFTEAAQEELFWIEESEPAEHTFVSEGRLRRVSTDGWRIGTEIEHEEFGRGWILATSRKSIGVRFETRRTGPGRVRTILKDDPLMTRPAILPMRWQRDED